MATSVSLSRNSAGFMLRFVGVDYSIYAGLNLPGWGDGVGGGGPGPYAFENAFDMAPYAYSAEAGFGDLQRPDLVRRRAVGQPTHPNAASRT